MISASQLYDYVQCPHRVFLDAFGDDSGRDEPNAFVELLWKSGLDHEAEIVASLGPMTRLDGLPQEDRERETLAAIKRRDPLIYGGRLTIEDLVGEPDLLELRGQGYVPGDIKSGSGFDGDEGEGKLKRHYAYQLAHYVNILQQLGLGDGSRDAFVIDRSGVRVQYVLMEPQGVRNKETWWDSYLVALNDVQQIIGKASQTLGALCAVCKLCHWHSSCRAELIARGDLSLVAELGRSKRDVMAPTFPTIHDFERSSPADFIRGKKTTFAGVGPASLEKFHERVKLLVAPDAKPYLKGDVSLPVAKNEVYFDIEADPMRDVVYLHGFVERIHGKASTAKFIAFFSESNESAQEMEVFKLAWEYLSQRVQDSTIYYYSKYERTSYKKLAEKYPNVCSVDDVVALFELPSMIDLYDVVIRATEWPTYDRSIKTLAQYLGFKWRDDHPSGAASIEWYHRWCESGDASVKQRILDYNEDDCLATGILVDGIRML